MASVRSFVVEDQLSLGDRGRLTTLWLQRSGGMLPEAQARSLLVGIGPAIAPPTLTGLPVPRQTVTQQTWQAAPQVKYL